MVCKRVEGVDREESIDFHRKFEVEAKVDETVGTLAAKKNASKRKRLPMVSTQQCTLKW